MSLAVHCPTIRPSSSISAAAADANRTSGSVGSATNVTLIVPSAALRETYPVARIERSLNPSATRSISRALARVTVEDAERDSSFRKLILGLARTTTLGRVTRTSSRCIRPSRSEVCGSSEAT